MGLKDLWQRIKGPPAHLLAGAPLPAAEPVERGLLEAKLDHVFRDPTLLDLALLHRSHAHVVRNSREDSNERLEFLGDAVLGLVVNDYLFRKFTDASEGELTKMKSLLVCRDRLAEVAADLELGAHIRMSRSEAATGGRRRASILADTTEAVICAVYLDGGLAAAQHVIARCLLADCDSLLARRGQDNHKSRLQELIQAQFKTPPRYRVTSAAGPDHARIFQVSVAFNGHILGRGEGPNKKTAEQEAARDALAALAERTDLLHELSTPPED